MGRDLKVLYSAPGLHIPNEWCELIARRLSEQHKTTSVDYRLYGDRMLCIQAQRLKPDLLLVIKGETIAPETIKYTRGLGTKTVLYDGHEFHHFNEPLYREFDHIFTPNKDFLPVYEKLGIKASRLMWLYDPKVHKKMDLPKIHDIVYVGTYYPERADIVKAFHRLGMQVYGNGWENICIKTERIVALQMVKLYNQSKIVLNLHQDAMKKATAGFNLRMVEAMGCGAFVISDYCPGMEEFFEDGKHLVIFNTPQDLMQKVLYYASHDDERERIAQAGHERVQEFSIDKFINKILEV